MAEKEQVLDSLLERSFTTDVPLLLKAREDAKRKVKDDPSAANLNALDRVDRMLRDAMSNQEGNKNFAKVSQVLAYLQGQGRKLSQAQLYKDLKRGYLRRQPDKSFRQKDVDAYATILPLVSMPEQKAEENSDLAREKMQEDIAKVREQRLSIAFAREKDSGKYILKAEVSLELASRAAALSLGLRSMFMLNAPDYIRMTGGDPEKAEELCAEFEKNLDMALNEYSRPMEFRAEFIAEKDVATDDDTNS